MKLPSPKELLRTELAGRLKNGLLEVVKKAPENARKSLQTWREKRREEER